MQTGGFVLPFCEEAFQGNGLKKVSGSTNVPFTKDDNLMHQGTHKDTHTQ
jgi:hypothetical protein